MATCQNLTYAQMIGMAQQAGFSGTGLINIVAIAQAESRGNTCAQDGPASGVLQFEPATAAEYGLSDPTDPQASFDAAYKLSSGGSDFNAWETFTTTGENSYHEFTAAVQSALATLGTIAGATAGSSAGSQASGTQQGKPNCPVAIDPFGIGQAICDAASGWEASAETGVSRANNAALIAFGSILLVVGAGVVFWPYIRSSAVGQGLARVGHGALDVAKVAAL